MAEPAEQDDGPDANVINLFGSIANKPAAEPAATAEPAEPATIKPAPLPEARATGEQAAIAILSADPNPIKRQQAIQYAKQQFANDTIIDGMNARQRERAKNTSIGLFMKSLHDNLTNDKVPYEQRVAQIKAQIGAMWNDPALIGEGETQAKLEEFAMKYAGIEDTRSYGSGYDKVLEGIDNGTITSANQLLHMATGPNPTLSTKGFERSFQILRGMDKPDVALFNQLEANALKRIKERYYQGADENAPLGFEMNKPTSLQIRKVQEASTALINKIIGTKGDLKEAQKVVSDSEVDALADQLWPTDQRRFDWLTRGQSQAAVFAGIKLPINLPDDPKVQNEYKLIVGAPPAAVSREGKQGPGDQQAWQENVERLRANPKLKEQFKAMYPDSDPDHILKELPSIGPPVSPEVTTVAPGAPRELARVEGPVGPEGAEAIPDAVRAAAGTLANFWEKRGDRYKPAPGADVSALKFLRDLERGVPAPGTAP